jgi:predicted nucleic acid-binding protein
MIVVSDTTPIHYLILTGAAESLKALFGHVIVPQAVFDELHKSGTPQQVTAWIDSRPDWIEIRQPSFDLPDAAKSLGKGEREAIALAVEVRADAMLTDDKKAMNEAKRRNVPVITTLNILESAAAADLLDLPDAIDRLAQTNFFFPSAEAIESLLERNRQRKATRQEKPE